MKIVVGGLFLIVAVVLFGSAWVFRYERVPPLIYTENSPRGRALDPSVVVCTADRWTNYLNCVRVGVDTHLDIREMEEFARQHKKK
jgi:hypothetical protein